MISQTQEFLIYVYLRPFVCNFAVQLAFVASVLAIMFSTKVNFIHIHLITPSTKIVPHSQRDLVKKEGNLTIYHSIYFF